MKQPEWQRGGICDALSSTSQQLNLEPSEQRERERSPQTIIYHTMQLNPISGSSEVKMSQILCRGQNVRISSFYRHILGFEPISDLYMVAKCAIGNFQPFTGPLFSHLEKYLNGNNRTKADLFSRN